MMKMMKMMKMMTMVEVSMVMLLMMMSGRPDHDRSRVYSSVRPIQNQPRTITPRNYLTPDPLPVPIRRSNHLRVHRIRRLVLGWWVVGPMLMVLRRKDHHTSRESEPEWYPAKGASSHSPLPTQEHRKQKGAAKHRRGGDPQGVPAAKRTATPQTSTLHPSQKRKVISHHYPHIVNP